MFSRKRSASLVAAVVSALFIALTQPPIALAAVATARNTTMPVSSGALIVFASGTQTFVNPGNSYNVAVSNGMKTFYVNNSGNFSTAGFALIISLPTGSNVSSFKRCALNVAFVGNNTCASGSAINVSITPGSPTTYMIALPVNSFYSFQISQNKSGTMQVHTYANTSHITNTNSSS
jgi:hypothetical protein